MPASAAAAPASNPATRRGKRWDKMRGPNLDAAYFTSAYAMPMLARSGKGAIVNISSTATLHGNWGLYCVAKAAIEGLTRALWPPKARRPWDSRQRRQSRLDRHGKRRGGTARAAMPAVSGRFPARCSTAWDVRRKSPRAVLFLASDDASFVTGQTLIVDGGLSITD